MIYDIFKFYPGGPISLVGCGPVSHRVKATYTYSVCYWCWRA